MTLRIYEDGNVIVLYDVDEGVRAPFAKGTISYRFDENSGIYSFYAIAGSEKKLMFQHIVNTLRVSLADLQKKDGSGFATNEEFESYVNRIIVTRDVSIDAGGRARVSQANVQLDVKQINDDQPLFYSRESVGAGSQVYSQNDGGVIMSVTANGDKAIAQTKMMGFYLSGQSELTEITSISMQIESQVIKRMGYFSTSTTTPFNTEIDGIFFESNGDTMDYRFKIIKKDGIELLNVPQSQWNVDTLSGYDFANFSVFALDFLYLGGTGVALGFARGRKFFKCHEYDHAGLVPSTFLVSPNQPLRWEIESTGGAGSMIQVCGLAASEGSTDIVGTETSFHAYNFQANNALEIYAVIGVRLKANYRNIRVAIESVSFQAQNNDDFTWFVMLNPTLDGTPPVFGTTDDTGLTLNNTVLEVAIGNGGGGGTRNIVTNAELIQKGGQVEGTTASGQSFKTSISPGTQIDGTPDELWVCLRPRTAGLNVDVTPNFREFI